MLATNIDVYFCDPKARGSAGRTETNGLLRQYFPKGTDLSVHRKPIRTKRLVSSTNDHVRPCNLKPQQRI
jgi:IS30 family transposase